MHRLNMQFLAMLSVVVCTMLWISGCSQMGASQPVSEPVDLAPLEEELKSKDLTITKLRAEVETLKATRGFVMEELERTRRDLEYVEKQFISLERGLQSHESKASAVAALAEAKLALDKILRENPSAHNLPYIQLAKETIDRSDQLLLAKRYAASVYFAKRALRVPGNQHVSKTIRVVSARKANMRSGPGVNYDVVLQLNRGTVLIELGSSGAWRRVEIKTGEAGWVHKTLTR